MRKEVVVAVLIGLIMGLIITFGVYQSRGASTSNNPKPEVVATDSNSITNNSQQLMITSPDDESIVETKAISVTGTTQPQNFVVIFVNDKAYITTSDDSGNFSVEVTLSSVANIIIVNALKEDGTTSTEERTVIYFSDSLEATSSELLKEATASASLAKEASASSKTTTKTKAATSSAKTKT